MDASRPRAPIDGTETVHSEAITAYRDALRLRPDDTTALYNLGIALKESGQPEAAVAAYRYAIGLDPVCHRP